MGSPFRPAIESLARQRWLDKAGEPLAKGVAAAYRTGGPSGQRLKDLLHGVWLGHPLHPAVIVWPLGAWTTAVALDALDLADRRRRLGAGADAAVTLGIAGAVLAAASGITDWQHTQGRPRRLGVVHAALNTKALALFTASLVARRRGARGAGRTLALLGFAVGSAAAYIGGDLSYDDQIGVNHAAQQEPGDEFVDVMAESELREGEPRRVQAGDVAVVLVRNGGRIHGLAATCSHLGGPLDEGRLVEGCIVCPWHDSAFALDTGEVVHGPATFPQPRFGVRVRNGRIEVGPSDGDESSWRETARDGRAAQRSGDGLKPQVAGV